MARTTGNNAVVSAASIAAAVALFAFATEPGAMDVSRDAPIETAAPAAAQTAAPSPGTDPTSLLRAKIAAAWADTTRVWAQLIGQDAIDAYTPQIAFVAKVQATHCYGLYISAGPVYCSANNTVFVSLDEMLRLEHKLPGFGDEGLTLLVAHEFGHHVQKLSGRFRLLSSMMHENPGAERDLVRRFELEADCLAGFWAGHSHAELAGPVQRQALLRAAEAIGDDRTAAVDAAEFTHGSAAQRRRWFEAGMAANVLEDCDVLHAASY